MSWIGGSISSLTGQLSNLTKDILTEGTEEVGDPSTELRLANEKIQQLDSLLSTQKQENDRLKRINKELEERAESSELQINAISREYRTLLEDKEKEVNALKHQHQDLLEHHARAAALSSTDGPQLATPAPASPSGHGDFASLSFETDPGDWDFDDSIRLQRENNYLRSELQRAQGDAKHWKSVAGQLGQNAGQDNVQQAANASVLDLQHKVKSLENQLGKKKEELQQQAASLHEHHRQKVATLKNRHQTEITALQHQLSSLEQQLADAHDGGSSQRSGSGNLPESDRHSASEREVELQQRLTDALHEKEKAQNARSHLEGMLEELQQEVERLQQQQEEAQQVQQEEGDQVVTLQKKVAEFSHKLQESEAQREISERQLQETQDELKIQLTQSLQTAKAEQEKVLAQTESVIEKIGEGQQQEHAAELLDSLEKENLLLKEERLKLEEQITLLEKAASTSAAERQQMQQRVTALSSQLRNLTGEDTYQSDDTLDCDFSSGTSTSKNAALHVGQEEIEKELVSLRAQLQRLKEKEELSGEDIERDDWLMEREALEDVVTELRQKSQEQEEEIRSLRASATSSVSRDTLGSADSDSHEKLDTLEAEISSLKEEKQELENALEELDSQHSQALDQLIQQRDKLAAELAKQNSALQKQEEQTQLLTFQLAQHGKSAEAGDQQHSTDDQQQLAERCQQLEAELTEIRNKVKSNQSSSGLEREVADLREKLHKGGLVINDLHMDKQELEEELRLCKKEMAAKVDKLKEMREQNVALGKEKSALEEKITEMEDRLLEVEEELEKWQQMNEDRQVQQMQAGAEHEECERLKSQVANMVQEKQRFFVNFDHLAAEDVPQSDSDLPFEDTVFEKILEEEAKVRKKIEADNNLIRDLKQQVQKLYDDKQRLKSEVENLHRSQDAESQRVTQLEAHLQELNSQIDTLSQEKSDLQQKLTEETVQNKDLTSKLSAADSKLEEAGKQLQDISTELTSLQQQKQDLVNQLESQQRHYDAYIEELKAGQELGAESLQAEHQRLLDCQRDMKLEMDKLQGQVREKEELEKTLGERNQEVEQLNSKVATFKEEIESVHMEISRLEATCLRKDEEIHDLKGRMSQFDTDLAEIEESVSAAEDKHHLELSSKEDELKELRTRNSHLERTLSQRSPETCQPHPTTEGKSPAAGQDIMQLQTEIEQLRQERSDDQHLQETISQLEIELALCNETISKLNQDLAMAQYTIQCHEAGIVDLNEKADEQRHSLEKAEIDVTRQKSTIAVLRQTSVEKDTQLQEINDRLSFLVTILTPDQLNQLHNYSTKVSGVPALQYKGVKAIEFSSNSSDGVVVQDIQESQYSHLLHSSSQGVTMSQTDLEFNGYIVDEDFDSSNSEFDRFATLEKEMDELRGRLKEKDNIVAQLQKSNSSLLALLEKGGGGVDRNMSSQMSVHKMEAELRNLKTEREQMVAVVSEKSRENSSLKSEVHRLMEVVAAGQAALGKLQEDNRNLEQRKHSPAHDDGEDEMRREALANMARLVRDRETEIEALKQKNETLLAVLHESGETQAATHLVPLLRDKEALSQQLAEVISEREQLIAFVTQKHSESLAYHAEVQRLTALLSDTQAACEKAKSDYTSLIPAFEDKSQALVAAQNELVQCKQKLADLEVRHGELIQRSNSQDSSRSPELSSLEDEVERLKRAERDLRSMLAQRDEKIQTLSHRLSSLEEELTSRETECGHLRKQVENSKFQLTGLMAELADLKAEKEQIQQRTSAQDTESASLRESFNKLSLEAREKDSELSSLKEEVMTLTSLLQEQQGEQGQVTKLIRDNEAAVAATRQLQQERDQQAMMAGQRLQEANALKTEVASLKDKEFKLHRELERLRGHLIQIEDGYTKEALESEEREKELRNRLAASEELLISSSSQVEMASQESLHQIEHLQQQLQHVSNQRDQAYMQVANSQDQCQQYASSLSNLQMVLEHFQKEKDSAIAAETEHLHDEVKILKIEVGELQKELDATRGDLTEALEGLEAASRLTEQLDRKEEAISALREEVQLREEALNEVEEKIRKLSSSTEAKVDKTLIHNMVMTWLTSPENKRREIVHLIGNILSFSQEDFQKIETTQNQSGLLSGLFRRSSATPPTSPAHEPQSSQSFSQLFVKFLEKESSPPPTPVRLPAEAMAAEAQHRHKPAFNPFMAPRHVTHPEGQRTASPSSHILMSHDSMAAPSPFFTPLTSVPSSGESAILKDVLGKR